MNMWNFIRDRILNLQISPIFARQKLMVSYPRNAPAEVKQT
jgi:hypothetical protein